MLNGCAVSVSQRVCTYVGIEAYKSELESMYICRNRSIRVSQTVREKEHNILLQVQTRTESKESGKMRSVSMSTSMRAFGHY